MNILINFLTICAWGCIALVLWAAKDYGVKNINPVATVLFFVSLAWVIARGCSGGIQ